MGRPERSTYSSRGSSPGSPTSTPSTVSTPTDRARLSIDLAAIEANWRACHARHPSGAVLKADAYGLGAVPIAERLRRAGCRTFFVATAEEALALRPHVHGCALVTLNGLDAGAEAALAAAGVEPALASLGQVERWAALGRRLGRALPAWLHVDTGLSRLGLPLAEVSILRSEPQRLAGIAPRFVMSHLASAEDAGATSNVAQRAALDALGDWLPLLPRSLANSAGLFRGPDFATDLARPGAALYGINPTPGRANPQHGVLRLTAPVLQVRDIPPGVSVGYNGTWTAARHSRIATIGVGYADGWPRSLSGRGRAAFDGRLLPLVGRVSMDLSTYDVTDAPGVQPGSALELVGPDRPVDVVAEEAGTIGYEILTSLGRRYARVAHG